MKQLFFIPLFSFLVVMSGCIKDSDYIYNRKDCPVLLQYSSNLMKYYFISPIDGNCLVSDIPDGYDSGDALWVDYTIHMKHQEYSNIFSTEKVVIHSKIKCTKVKDIVNGNLSDDYNTPIDGFFAKPAYLGTTIFFGFSHKAPAGQTFEYEMLYDPIVEYQPVLYIKSRKTNEVTGTATEIKTMAGFDITPFFYQYKNENNTLRFHVRYLSEINDGKEVYKYYSNDVMVLILVDE